ncbi:MAG: hypothetical protein AAF587_12435 [Bacteroidota bacterium]
MLNLSHWPIVGQTDLVSLSEATEQVHRAAQYLSMAGKFFLPHKADDSHTNMGWNPEHAWLYSHELPTYSGHFLGLHPETMRLLLINQDHSIEKAYNLIGKTQKDGVAWIKGTLKQYGIDTSAYKIVLHYEIPDHDIHHGAPFRALSPAAYAGFSKVRSMGHEVMEQLVATIPQASETRTWPHHFDIGNFLPLHTDAEGKTDRALYVGLAIPDHLADDYYFYVTHGYQHGQADYSTLPPLPSGGYWNRKEFVGAFLLLADLIQSGSSEQQIDNVSAFMKKALEASIHLLDLNPSDFLS